MKTKEYAVWAGPAVLAAGALAVMPLWADESERKGGPDASAEEAAQGGGEKADADSKVEERGEIPPPKPISDQVRNGLAYLAKVQNEDGGWGQGGGWRINTEGQGRIDKGQAEDRSDVGNTCIAMLAFLRAGEELRTGEYAEALRKGATYLFDSIESVEDGTLYVTHVRDTQLQSKIGRYVDTFLAAHLLAELKGRMPTPEAEERRAKLLDKVVAKIGAHQRDDGAFAGNGGWASVLSQGICSRGLNAARLAGAKVTDEMLERDNRQNLVAANPQAVARATAGEAAGGPSSAGVSLYWASSKVRGLAENSRVNLQRREQFEQVVESEEATPDQKQQAQAELEKIEVADEATVAAVAQVAKQVDDAQFVQGFGNNGGEEFLSYMNISETLRTQGGQDWIDWDKKISKTINAAQNEDGSWSGHHCITGRTFCTAGALLTLLADRAPLPEEPRAKNEAAVSKVESE